MATSEPGIMGLEDFTTALDWQARDGLAEYRTAGGGVRGFCGGCGSSLWFRAADGGFRWLHSDCRDYAFGRTWGNCLALPPGAPWG